MTAANSWAWKKPPPRNEAQLEEMMRSLDEHLGKDYPEPGHRPLQALRSVARQYGYTVNLLTGANERGAPWSPSDIFWRVSNWYKQVYAERININFSPGSVAIELRNAFWEMAFPRHWGVMRAFVDRNLSNEGHPGLSQIPSFNILRSIKGLTQAMANSLSDFEVSNIESRFIHAFPAIVFLDKVNGHDFFDLARTDYRHGIQALISQREPHHAKWQIAHAAEKLAKGLLDRRGFSYPKGGQDGHDIPLLAQNLTQRFQLVFDSAVLQELNCPTKARYGQIPVSQNDAYKANSAFVDFARTFVGKTL